MRHRGPFIYVHPRDLPMWRKWMEDAARAKETLAVAVENKSMFTNHGDIASVVDQYFKDNPDADYKQAKDAVLKANPHFPEGAVIDRVMWRCGGST